MLETIHMQVTYIAFVLNFQKVGCFQQTSFSFAVINCVIADNNLFCKTFVTLFRKRIGVIQKKSKIEYVVIADNFVMTSNIRKYKLIILRIRFVSVEVR